MDKQISICLFFLQKIYILFNLDIEKKYNMCYKSLCHFIKGDFYEKRK